ncbi:MAG: hypothetical protein E7647_02135 [Ruminococcaceae bacterium]|nr:hypothetical protein [Oscillospiraceae bacterium]
MVIDICNLRTRENAKTFVRECENNFKISVESAAGLVAADKRCKAVTLAGPTCSGKTTAASLLIAELARLGKNAKLISIDDFYYPQREMERLGITDFEGASAIDTSLFRKCSASLAALEVTVLPYYDFKTHERGFYPEYTPKENDIYIFEGIQAIYPEILSCLDSFGTVSLFICVADKIEIGGISFEPNEIRLMRRVVRDFYHRGTSIEKTMVLWDNVRKNEDENIFPFVGNEDFSINSLIPYEIFLVGREFLEMSRNYPEDGRSSALVASLRERLSGVMNDNFDHSLISENSLLREFSE